MVMVDIRLKNGEFYVWGKHRESCGNLRLSALNGKVLLSVSPVKVTLIAHSSSSKSYLEASSAIAGQPVPEHADIMMAFFLCWRPAK